MFRARAQTADRLMREAGWALVDQGGERVWKKGKEVFPKLYFPAWNSGEFNLLVSRFNQFGIKVDIHDIQSSPLYRTILQKGQFDLMPRQIYHADIPNESLRSLWSVAAAEDPSHSYNFSRFKNKAVDDLVGRLIRSDSNHERAVLTRALDQVLLQESPVILTQQSNGVKTWVRGANLNPPLPLPANGESPLFTPTLEAWWENKGRGRKQSH